MAVRLAEHVLDLDARRLTRAGRDVHLSPKGFDLLRVLVEAGGRALSKDELLGAVWPDVFVSDASLARTIAEIRAALGDSGSIIRTVHRFGYAFVAAREVQHAAAPAPTVRACWWLVHDGRSVPLANGEHVIGREPGGVLHLDRSKVSRRHARIVVNDGRATLEDLGSKNGTFLGRDPNYPTDVVAFG